MPDEIQIQIRFTFPAVGKYPAFADALYMTQAAYAALTDPQLVTLKNARYDAWKAVLDTPPPTPTGPDSVVALQAALLDIYGKWKAVQVIAGVEEIIPLLPMESKDPVAVLAEHGYHITPDDFSKLIG